MCHCFFYFFGYKMAFMAQSEFPKASCFKLNEAVFCLPGHFKTSQPSLSSTSCKMRSLSLYSWQKRDAVLAVQLLDSCSCSCSVSHPTKGVSPSSRPPQEGSLPASAYFQWWGLCAKVAGWGGTAAVAWPSAQAVRQAVRQARLCALVFL